MTVSSIVPVNNYTGNGSSTKFDFDFLIENDNELVVTLFHKNGSSENLKLNVDYSINEIGNKNGSFIIFPIQGSIFNILNNEETLSLALSLPIKQESEFENSSTLNLNILEKTFDYIVRILQIMSRKVDRSMKVQEGSKQNADELIESLFEVQTKSQTSADNAEQAKLQAEKILQQTKKEGTIQINNIKATGFYMKEDKLYYLNSKGQETEFVSGSGGSIVGSTFFSPTPIKDSNVHLLDGGVIAKDGVYAEFYNKFILPLKTSNPELFVTEEQHAQEIAQYGLTNKFVDNTDNIRLPKFGEYNFTVNDKLSAQGNGMTLGLANGTTLAGATVINELGITGRTEVYGFPIGSANKTGDGLANLKSVGITTDPTKSGIEANLQSNLKGYWYIVLSSSSKTDIQVNLDNIATDLNNKADKDFANAIPNQSFIDKSISWVTPDYSKGINFSMSKTGYTAPQDGVVTGFYNGAGGAQFMFINGYKFNYDSDQRMAIYVYLAKGDVLSGGSDDATNRLYFFPLKGAN